MPPSIKITMEVDVSDSTHLDAAIAFLQQRRDAFGMEADKPATGKAAKPKATKAKDPDPPAEPDEPTGPSLDDVRKKLKNYAALEGKDAAIQILKDNDAASITELDEDKYQAVIDACGED